MIQDFLDSWYLFQNAYTAGWLMAVLLAIVGVLVVARDQIFLGAAIAEASTLGIALAMAFTAWHPLQQMEWADSEAFLSVASLAFSLLAALLTTRAGGPGRESHESVTGWVFLVGGSLSILVVSHSAHGMEEVHKILASSIIGASQRDLWVLWPLTIVAGTGVLLVRRKLLLVLSDAEMAQAVGMRTRLWEAVISVLLGVSIGVCLRISGMLYTFGCLVLPALAARNFCRTASSVFFVAPLVGLLAATAAFILGNYYDQPIGPMTAALLCGIVGVASLGRRVMGRG